MLVPRGDDGAGLAAGLVGGPAHRVLLLAELHGALVLVPAADLPQSPAGGQFSAYVGDVARVVGPPWNGPNAREDHEQIAVGANRPDAQVIHAAGARHPGKPPF